MNEKDVCSEKEIFSNETLGKHSAHLFKQESYAMPTNENYSSITSKTPALSELQEEKD